MRRHPGNSAGLEQAEQTEETAVAAPALEGEEDPREAVASQQPLLPV